MLNEEHEKFWEESVIKDSGQRREFSTGAVRDMACKGRCDLLPWEVVGRLMNDNGLSFCTLMEDAVNNSNTSELIEDLEAMFYEFTKLAFNADKQEAFLQVAFHYEAGCKKYGDRNWQKGIPVIVFLDSAGRHFIKYQRGDADERHDRAVLWNLMGAMWTVLNMPELVGVHYDG